MARQPKVIIRAGPWSVVVRQLREEPPDALTTGEAVLDTAPQNAGSGKVEPPGTGIGVFSLTSFADLLHERDALTRAITEVGDGPEPFEITIQEANELRDEHLQVALDASSQTTREVVLRVLSDGR